MILLKWILKHYRVSKLPVEGLGTGCCGQITVKIFENSLFCRVEHCLWLLFLPCLFHEYVNLFLS